MNGKPAVLRVVHHKVLIGNHGLVQITHCRWRWFLSYATSPIIVTLYDVSIVIVYDI